MEFSLYALIITNLVCSSIYTSYIFCAQIIIFPLMNEKYYADHLDRSTKAYTLFLVTEFITSVIMTIYDDVLIIPMILLLIAYIFMILMYRLEDLFISHIINDDYDKFRVYGWVVCGLCFIRWCFLYLYVLFAD